MPQRHRPRLKQTPIKCDQCGATAMKLYPSRPAVRARMSPYRFCSSTCQREHWEARRKAEWVAVVYACAHCGKNPSHQTGPRPAAGLLLRRVQAEGGSGAVTAESCRRSGCGPPAMP